ncbi:hypothetical protein Tco_0342142 [Tanacetum coccineum]
MWLKLTPMGLVKERSILELFYCATSASFTTMAYALQRHYKSVCPELKNQNHGNQAEGSEARGMVYALGGGETDQDPNCNTPKMGRSGIRISGACYFIDR